MRHDISDRDTATLTLTRRAWITMSAAGVAAFSAGASGPRPGTGSPRGGRSIVGAREADAVPDRLHDAALFAGSRWSGP